MTDDNELTKVADWAVRNAFDEFDAPDDNWPATLAYTYRRGSRVLAIDTYDRDAACARIEQILSAAHAIEAVWITTCWFVQYADGEMAADGTVPESLLPSLHPDRREGVSMAHVTADSFELWTADLTRFTDRPPRLGPFVSRGRDLAVGGPYADAMRSGIS
jgi:hypothetical protein